MKERIDYLKLDAWGKRTGRHIGLTESWKFRVLLAVFALNCAFTLSKILILASLQYFQGEKRYSHDNVYSLPVRLRVNESWGMRHLTPCFLFNSGESCLLNKMSLFLWVHSTFPQWQILPSSPKFELNLDNKLTIYFMNWMHILPVFQVVMTTESLIYNIHPQPSSIAPLFVLKIIYWLSLFWWHSFHASHMRKNYCCFPHRT